MICIDNTMATNRRIDENPMDQLLPWPARPLNSLETDKPEESNPRPPTPFIHYLMDATQRDRMLTLRSTVIECGATTSPKMEQRRENGPLILISERVTICFISFWTVIPFFEVHLDLLKQGSKSFHPFSALSWDQGSVLGEKGTFEYDFRSEGWNKTVVSRLTTSRRISHLIEFCLHRKYRQPFQS